jgi:genome maintenance exonuclease 1
MNNFIQHNIPKLNRIDGGPSRLYETPSGELYPSVTSVLGMLSANSIQEWRNRVGEEEANRISNRASSRGTRIHTLCEDYLTKGVAKPDMFDAEMFNSIRPHLDKINNIHALETPLYSNYLQVAGTVDVICEYNKKLSIVDFKTSSRIKSRDDIHSYFMQCSAYAYMFYELTGVVVPNILIIMGVEHELNAFIYEERVVDWLEKFIEIRKQYKIKFEV